MATGDRRQWWQADTVVTAGCGGEGTSSGNRAENVTLTCAASAKIQRRKDFCAGGRARPRFYERGNLLRCTAGKAAILAKARSNDVMWECIN